MYESLLVVLLDLKSPNFKRSHSLSPGPQSSLVPPCKISLGGPGGELGIYNELLGDTMTLGSCLEILIPMMGNGALTFVNSVMFFYQELTTLTTYPWFEYKF